MVQSTYGEVLQPYTLDNEYRIIHLPNSLNATLIHCKDCKEGGAAISVKVGSYYDTVPGIAHFLEHMIFISSKTYPETDTLMNYIGSNKGYTNAYTSTFETVFFFKVANKALAKSVHILSRSIAEPIFNKEAAVREISAVESEYRGDIRNDGWRIYRLFQILNGKPLSKSTIGSLKTLNIPGITEKLYEFWSNHYRAENLNFAIYGSQSLDELENIVKYCFSDIKKGAIEKHAEKGAPDGNVIYGKKITAGVSIYLWWKLYGENSDYALLFISYLLNFSLNKNLKLKYGTASFEVYSDFRTEDYKVLTIDANVIQNGIRNKEICEDLLASIESLKSLDRETLFELWKDYHLLNKYDFYYADELEPAQLVRKIAANMIYYSEEDLYSEGITTETFSYESIMKILNSINSDNAYTVILEEKPSVSLDTYDDPFEMYYKISHWEISSSSQTFTNLKKNPYIPKDLKLVNNKFTSEIILYENKKHQLWFKYDTVSKKPYVHISALLFVPEWNQHKIPAIVFAGIVNEMINRNLNYNKQAGFSSEIKLEYSGIIINIQGWNAGIVEYTKLVIDTVLNSSLSWFEASRRVMIKLYENSEKKLSLYRAIGMLKRLLLENSLSKQEVIEGLSKLTYSEYLSFINIIKDSTANVLVTGNINPPHDISQIFEAKFNGKTTEKVYEKSIKTPGYQIYTAKTAGQNAILNWYQFGSFDYKASATTKIIGGILRYKAFSFLRTKSQLGYIVFLTSSNKLLTNSLYLAAQGPKYNPSQMQFFINLFWQKVKITKKEFTNYIASVIPFNPIKKQPEMHYYYWNQITNGLFDFEYSKKLETALGQITYEDVLNTLEKLKNHHNELSIRLYTNYSQSKENSISLDYYRKIS